MATGDNNRREVVKCQDVRKVMIDGVGVPSLDFRSRYPSGSTVNKTNDVENYFTRYPFRPGGSSPKRRKSQARGFDILHCSACSCPKGDFRFGSEGKGKGKGEGVGGL